MHIIKRSLWIFVVMLLIFSYKNTASASETMADYADYPIFMSNSVKPNILILLDNSGSMNDYAYPNQYDPTKNYYGYFSYDRCYSYISNDFVIDTSDPIADLCTSPNWSGNFLNWAAMRRVDVARKVLMGGLATSRTGGGNTTNKGDSGSGWWNWSAHFNYSSAYTNLVPDAYLEDSTWKYSFEQNGGSIEMWRLDKATSLWEDMGVSFNIWIQKDETLEPNDFVDGNIAGIMQKVKNEARWGLEFFNQGGGTGEGYSTVNDGGSVVQAITGTGYGTNMITDIQNTPADTWTPLAESLYIAAGYFAQDSSMEYSNNDIPPTIQGNDPFYYDDLSQYVPCPKNFVLIITDGGATMDSNIPSTPPTGYPNSCTGGSLQDCDGDGNDAALGAWDYSSSHGHDYFDDVALWAHTTDLRGSLTGEQNLTIYAVYAFGNDTAAEALIKQAAKNGGFEDSNNNDIPDLTSEWDSDNDGEPDTFFKAEDGAELEKQLMAAITGMLKRATSGTAISVLAAKSSGEGSIYQAYFLPKKTEFDSAGNARELTWLGHLLSFNIDANGDLRDASGTQCLNFSFDVAKNETVVKFFPPDATTDKCPATPPGSASEKPLTDLTSSDYVWDAGEKLLIRSATRSIFTYIPGTGKVNFTTSNVTALTPYLDITGHFASTPSDPADPSEDPLDLINFIRGVDVPTAGYRERTMSSGGTDYEWKLGDIVSSTPTVVAAPAEAYNLLYKDQSFKTFFSNNKNRNEVVYVGANDGMLHAFDITTGDELWAYIPFNLLPHLKWLADPDYTHVNYVDLKAKVSDVKIGGSWKTVLIGGMGMGGGEISDASATSPSVAKRVSSYFALDITDPASPSVLWEYNHPDLGFAMSYPAIAKVGSQWYVVFGSGSDALYVPDYDGNSTRTAKLFVLDVANGSLGATFSAADGNSFFSNPISVDIDFIADPPSYDDYDIEAIYVGETYWKPNGGGSWNSRMMRLVPGLNSPTSDSPSPSSWTLTTLFDSDADQPITSAPATSSDELKQPWVYFGTGKYLNDADKMDTNTQRFYGIKDPCWDISAGAWDNGCLGGTVLTSSSLEDTTGITVTYGGQLSSAVAGQSTVETLSDELVNNSARNGWRITLSSAGERSLNKPTIFNGLTLFTSFIPDDDICGFSGSSYTYSLFYTSGTAWKESTIGCTGTAECTNSNDVILSRTAQATVGLASSIAIHAGREEGFKALSQGSTGATTSITGTSAFDNNSGVISWREL